MLFNGQALWGTTALVCLGPFPKSRAIQERLPGIDGFRMYRMGADHVVWNASGRITSGTRQGLESQLWAGARLVLANTLANFTTTLGGTFANCQLNSFEPATPIKRLGNGVYTMRVQGTVVWITPGSGGPGFAYQS